jgi:acylphosphatase
VRSVNERYLANSARVRSKQRVLPRRSIVGYLEGRLIDHPHAITFRMDESKWNLARKAMTARHVHVTGRVQGVWFRAWTRQQAEARGISGWVRNRSDGSVEAVIAGPDDAVDAMIAALREGPPAAKVMDIRITEAEAPAEPGFHIVG